MPELVLSAEQESQADAIFGAVESSFGAHPDFSANAQPIRDAIRAFITNPKALVPILSFVAKFVPAGPTGTVLSGIIAFLNVLPSQGPTSTTTQPAAGDPGALP